MVVVCVYARLTSVVTFRNAINVGDVSDVGDDEVFGTNDPEKKCKSEYQSNSTP